MSVCTHAHICRSIYTNSHTHTHIHIPAADSCVVEHNFVVSTNSRKSTAYIRLLTAHIRLGCVQECNPDVYMYVCMSLRMFIVFAYWPDSVSVSALCVCV